MSFPAFSAISAISATSCSISSSLFRCGPQNGLNNRNENLTGVSSGSRGGKRTRNYSKLQEKGFLLSVLSLLSLLPHVQSLHLCSAAARRTASTTLGMLIPVMQRRSMGQSRRKHGEHCASDRRT